MALPLSPARSGDTRRSDGTPRRDPARLSAWTWPAALVAVACCGLAACGTASAPGTGTTRTVTVQASSAPGTPAGGTTPTTATQAPAGPGTCLASGLTGSVGNSQGAAGTLYFAVVLTNESATSCTLYGYPGVSFVTGPGGSQIGAPANRNPISPVTQVTLAPGGQANMLIALTDVGVYPPSACQPTTVSTLRVYPPGDYDSIYVQYSGQTCALSTKVVMTVSAVRTGLTGPGA